MAFSNSKMRKNSECGTKKHFLEKDNNKDREIDRRTYLINIYILISIYLPLHPDCSFEQINTSLKNIWTLNDPNQALNPETNEFKQVVNCNTWNNQRRTERGTDRSKSNVYIDWTPVIFSWTGWGVRLVVFHNISLKSHS